VREHYDAFIADFRRLRPSSPAACYRAQTLLVHAWRKFPFLDPDLPAELLPSRWPRRRAHDLFTARHSAWSLPAREYFEELEAGRSVRLARAA
jgi:phenylacetic acid degradation operon negative regulatory protein